MSDYPVLNGAGETIIGGDGGAPVAEVGVINGPAGLSVLNTDLLSGLVSGWIDASAYGNVAVQVVGSAGISAGAVIFEQTNDKAAAAAVAQAWEPATGAPITGAVTIAANASRVFLIPVAARYVRARISTAFVGGTVRAYALGRSLAGGVLPLSGTGASVSVVQATASALKSESVGPAAHDAVVSGNPNRIAGRALTANYAAVATGDVADLVTTLVGALVVRPFGIPETDWTYAAAAGGIVNTADVAMAAAAGAGLRRYVTGMQLRNAHATVATEVVVKDGATVIWRGQLPANSGFEGTVFATPLKTTANTALNVACTTTGAAVYVNAQGYTAP